MSYVASYAARLDRYTLWHGVVIERTVENTGILVSVCRTPALFDGDVEIFEQRPQLPEGGAAVTVQCRAHERCDLSFEVAFRIVEFRQRVVRLLRVALGGRAQAVVSFQSIEDLPRPSRLEVVRQLAAVEPHAQRHDMDMPAFDVLVQKDETGLCAVTHTLHILACDLPQLVVRETVFGSGIQGGVKHGILRAAVGFEVRFETTQRLADVEISLVRDLHRGIERRQKTALAPVDLILVVIKSTRRCSTGGYPRDHSS